MLHSQVENSTVTGNSSIKKSQDRRNFFKHFSLYDCFFFSNYHLTSLSFKDKILTSTEWRKICKNIDKLETDKKNTEPEARLRASHTTQLATNCLYKTSLPEDSACANISARCFYKQSKDPTDRYGQYYIMDKIHWKY